jgi:hypothetical protein
MPNNVQDSFFIALGAAFVVFTAVMAYFRGDRKGVSTAEIRYKMQARKVLRLHTALSKLDTAHTQTYDTLRNKALATCAQAKGLCEFYRSVVQRHSIYDFQPEIPEMRLPRELEPEDPPPLPLPSKNFNFQDQNKGKHQ